MTPRVLTVEDEPDLRLILQDNLEFEGYEVLSASTGRKGSTWRWPSGRTWSCSICCCRG